MSKAREYLEKLDAEFESTWEYTAVQLKLDLTEIIVAGLKKKGWTARDLARELRWGEGEIGRVLGSNAIVTFDEAAKLLHALGVQGKLSATQDAAARGTEQ